MKDYSKAVADYTQAINLDRAFANAYTDWGFSQYELQKADAVIADWRKAIELDNRLYVAKLALGAALYAQGNRDEGLRLGKSAIALAGKAPKVQILKKSGWGDVILQDAAKLLADPRL